MKHWHLAVALVCLGSSGCVVSGRVITASVTDSCPRGYVCYTDGTILTEDERWCEEDADACFVDRRAATERNKRKLSARIAPYVKP